MEQEVNNRTHKTVAVWLPVGLVEELDAMLAAQVAHVPGARVSRHGWISKAIRAALDATKAGRTS